MRRKRLNEGVLFVMGFPVVFCGSCGAIKKSDSSRLPSSQWVRSNCPTMSARRPLASATSFVQIVLSDWELAHSFERSARRSSQMSHTLRSAAFLPGPCCRKPHTVQTSAQTSATFLYCQDRSISSALGSDSTVIDAKLLIPGGSSFNACPNKGEC